MSNEICVALGNQCRLAIVAEPNGEFHDFRFRWDGSPLGGTWRKHLVRHCGWAMSHLNRFGGASSISDAAHSVRVSEYLAHLGANRETQRWALWHDAPETLGLGDIHHRVKHAFAEDLCNLDYALSVELCDVIGLDRSKIDLTAMKAADRAAGAFEAVHTGLVTGDEESVPGVEEYRKWWEAKYEREDWSYDFCRPAHACDAWNNLERTLS